MAVIVKAGEHIDSALKRLHREVMREGIMAKFREKMYFVSKSFYKREKRREWKKMKRRARAARRRARK